ncbi:Phosphoglycolate phosphatase [Hypsibius exemplaris]|uniref:Phosphoglycolate phosphatase n=1 Tax=Hypsibius exemplaris TaxID=2072580 RepID=A0A9X6N960_HYPEX|nr:Phosphoglycolate phosphatase [Hypsibius exemplaris]
MLPLDASNFATLLEDHDNFLFDCDGVLWKGNQLLAGAAESLTDLKKRGKKIYYITNNGASTRAQYAAKCRKLGLPAEEADIVCTAHFTALHVKDLLNVSDFVTPGTGPKIYVMGTPALELALTDLGLQCIGNGPDPVPEDFLEDDWRAESLDKDVRAVVVGFDKHISYFKLIKAACYLNDPKVHFVATNADTTFPSSSRDIIIPGTGCIVGPIVMACGRKPVIIGKPATLMIDHLKEHFYLDVSRSVFIGDNLHTDIGLANKCQMKSVLVLSGVSTLVEAKRYAESTAAADQDFVPTFYLDDMGTFYSLLLLS